MISRRDFLKETATIGITAAAAAAFWNAAPKSVEAYRNYITSRFVAGTPLPRKPKAPDAEVFHQPMVPMGGFGSAWSEMVKTIFYSAGLDKTIQSGDTVILKQHLGERNRTSYLRPHIVRSVVTEVKKKGGTPILVDTNTSYYPSARYGHMNHYDTAMSHGYTAETVGCSVVPWADGMFGADGVQVLIDGNQLNMVHIARLIAEGDSLIAFTHAKGHGSGIIGGTLKNLGIGAATAHGKMWDHNMRGMVSKQAYFPMDLQGDPSKCPGKSKCAALKSPWNNGDCTRYCPWKAWEVGENGITKWNVPKTCTANQCFDGAAPGLCSRVLPGSGCTVGFAVKTPASGLSVALQHENVGIRYTDTATGCWWLFPEGKTGAMNIMIDIQPGCDCVQYDGIHLVPDQGVLGCKDPVAIDTCFIDLCKAAPPIPGSQADILKLKAGDEKFGPVNVGDPYIQCQAGEKLGTGSRTYKITTVKPVPSFLWGDMPFYLIDMADKMSGFVANSEKDYKDPRAFYRS